jgi:hypothetical protein
MTQFITCIYQIIWWRFETDSKVIIIYFDDNKKLNIVIRVENAQCQIGSENYNGYMKNEIERNRNFVYILDLHVSSMNWCLEPIVFLNVHPSRIVFFM